MGVAVYHLLLGRLRHGALRRRRRWLHYDGGFRALREALFARLHCAQAHVREGLQSIGVVDGTAAAGEMRASGGGGASTVAAASSVEEEIKKTCACLLNSVKQNDQRDPSNRLV